MSDTGTPPSSASALYVSLAVLKGIMGAIRRPDGGTRAGDVAHDLLARAGNDGGAAAAYERWQAGASVPSSDSFLADLRARFGVTEADLKAAETRTPP